MLTLVLDKRAIVSLLAALFILIAFSLHLIFYVILIIQNITCISTSLFPPAVKGAINMLHLDQESSMPVRVLLGTLQAD